MSFGIFKVKTLTRKEVERILGKPLVKEIIRRHAKLHVVFWMSETGSVCADIYEYKNTWMDDWKKRLETHNLPR